MLLTKFSVALQCTTRDRVRKLCRSQKLLLVFLKLTRPFFLCLGGLSKTVSDCFKISGILFLVLININFLVQSTGTVTAATKSKEVERY